MQRLVASSLTAFIALSAPPLALAQAGPKHKTKRHKIVAPAAKMPTAQQLAAEQAQREAQSMLLLEQQQADEAQDLGGGVLAGASIPSRYGPIQVTITVAGGKVTDCKGTWDIDIPRSIQIDTNAFPLLQSDAVALQSAKLHAISGRR